MKAEVCVIRRRLRRITQTEAFIILDIIRKPSRRESKAILFTLLKIWHFRALFRKQWTAPGLGNHSVQ
jgi:hypothetical protein